jgi:hypothetical protein
MKFTVKYKSNQTYGTDDDSGNYIASVKRIGSKVAVSFDFKKPPPGKSNTQATDAAVKSLTINLSTTEALHLAASILAQAHHPSLANKTAYWMPPSFMPDLTRDFWQSVVSVDPRTWEKRIQVNNKSDAHLGEIELLVEFKLKKKDGKWVEKDRSFIKLLDMLPDTMKEIQIEMKDLGLYDNAAEIRITKATIKRLTGMRPTDYKH